MNFIIFQVKNIKYAIDTNYVKEIINIVYTEQINKSSFVDCLLNYHSRVIPAIESSKLFNLFHGDYNQDSVFVILDVGNFLFALLADNADSMTDEADEIPQNSDNHFIKGAFKNNNELVYVLDLGRVIEKISSDDNWRKTS